MTMSAFWTGSDIAYFVCEKYERYWHHVKHHRCYTQINMLWLLKHTQAVARYINNEWCLNSSQQHMMCLVKWFSGPGKLGHRQFRWFILNLNLTFSVNGWWKWLKCWFHHHWSLIRHNMIFHGNDIKNWCHVLKNESNNAHHIWVGGLDNHWFQTKIR